jgi:hypothetical protein
LRSALQSPPQDDEPDAIDPRTARQLAELEAMIGLGMRMLRAFDAQVEMETEAMAAGEKRVDARSREATALAFFRVSRAIRLSQMLERQLSGADAAPEPEPAANDGPSGHEAAAERAMRRLRLLTRRQEVRDFVRQAIEAEARERGDGFDRERAECRLDEATERGDAPEAVWLWRPLGELAEGLCRVLGVRYDPALWGEVRVGEAAEAGEADGAPALLRLYAARPLAARGLDGRGPGPPLPAFWAEDA